MNQLVSDEVLCGHCKEADRNSCLFRTAFSGTVQLTDIQLDKTNVKEAIDKLKRACPHGAILVEPVEEVSYAA